MTRQSSGLRQQFAMGREDLKKLSEMFQFAQSGCQTDQPGGALLIDKIMQSDQTVAQALIQSVIEADGQRPTASPGQYARH